MTDKNIVYQGQSFFDKVIECTGDVENAFAMALLNGINVTDHLEIGQVLKSPAVTKNQIVNIFNTKNRPASALSVLTPEPEPEPELTAYEFPGEFPYSF
ncbi:hypothetical protein FNO01nite_30570 [Flavobacterium noncentrifugens]|uniref:Uncharacterized protein n=1 Tax=Flavobacterium noncentrifugens TaxID=1128970 RepID=A0A1G9BVU0_9FLAO|nr:hypothetical protein [Flavobacterium noncentrifugens]GEP52385.1 hypothetical protein FNO01nite_30570 [Flavobacterium noncentrifugens]SDK43493.1 hypothetical protein SAMN04487935_3371 [Flavobacterium noncentrifugens]